MKKKRKKIPRNLYTEKDDKIIRQHYPHSTRNTIEKLLPKHTWASIRERAYKLKVKRKSFPNKPWGKEKEELLRQLYPTYPRQEIQEKIGKSWNAIIKKAHFMKIRRTISDSMGNATTISRQKLNMEKNQYMRIKELNKFEEVKIR